MAKEHPDKRRRRIKKRLITFGIYLVVLVGMAWFFESQATTTIIFIRHAEKAGTGGDDPPLTERGEARARELGRIMQWVDVDRGVDVIYATQYRRTQDTVRPLALSLGKEIRRYDANDTVSVLNEILTEHKGKISLVAAHGNTIRPMVEELGGSKHLPDITEDEHDNIYVVVIPWFGKVKTLRLPYGYSLPAREPLPETAPEPPPETSPEML